MRTRALKFVNMFGDDESKEVEGVSINILPCVSHLIEEKKKDFEKDNYKMWSDFKIYPANPTLIKFSRKSIDEILDMQR